MSVRDHRFLGFLTSILIALPLVLLPGCAGERTPTPAPAATIAATSSTDAARETERLNTWLDARYEEQLDFHPLQKTMLGRKDDSDRIDDMSEAGEDAEFAWYRGTVADMKRTFDRTKLTQEGQTSYDLWIY